MTPEDKEEKKKLTIEAFKIARRNSYMRMLYGDEQLFYMFLEGIKFAKTGELPKDVLDDPEFLKDPENYKTHGKK